MRHIGHPHKMEMQKQMVKIEKLSEKNNDNVL